MSTGNALFNALVRGESLSSGLRNLVSRNYRQRSIACYKAYFDWNVYRRTCNLQTDGRTNFIIEKVALSTLRGQKTTKSITWYDVIQAQKYHISDRLWPVHFKNSRVS